MDYQDEIIELTGEDGDTIKCEYLDTVLVDDDEYVVLLPIDEEHGQCDGCEECEETEVIIMKIERNGDEEYLVPVEDDEELEKAFEAFQEQIDYYDDEEDDLD